MEKEIELIFTLFKKSASHKQKTYSTDWWHKKLLILLDREKVIDYTAKPIPVSFNKVGEHILDTSQKFWILLIKGLKP